MASVHPEIEVTSSSSQIRLAGSTDRVSSRPMVATRLRSPARIDSAVR